MLHQSNNYELSEQNLKVLKSLMEEWGKDGLLSTLEGLKNYLLASTPLDPELIDKEKISLELMYFIKRIEELE